ncbi:MAG: SUMF1/EgtB/PvdO family nonheme iron enzyme [Anaerolineae bacterium]|jgi:hypothetical protein|nr:SUMF1/EgtB/PvdO family nonheme iron enzyme [Anaerolineae bacterium]
MKLFISYARVDQGFCTQLIELLADAHDVWYDQRVYVGSNWWNEICREIAHSEGFVYLLSPDSLKSEYCQKEYRRAVAARKIIFPVLIVPCELSPELNQIQYVDFSKGITVQAVRELLNAITLAERSFFGGRPLNGDDEPDVYEDDTVPTVSQDNVILRATALIDRGDYDAAAFLLRRAIEEKISDDFISLERMLRHVERLLEKHIYQRDAIRSYGSIQALVKSPKMRDLGCMAFQSFRQRYPDYDPDNIAGLCARLLIPMLDWCQIPAGEVTLEYEQRRVTHYVAAFQMSKYPITNAQFKMFVDAPDGYCDTRWWDFATEACEWRSYHPQALKDRVAYGDHPRVNVSWYEAQAFCNWLSDRTGLKIGLPTDAEWQRAAQGDDGRQYPWGNRFDKLLCNCADSKIRRTTPVTRFVKGASPFGVLDLAGNIWEWCATARTPAQKLAEGEQPERIIRGGSYSSPFKRIRTTQRLSLKPNARYASIGFRVIAGVETR